jgi:hypothetical protein
MARGVQMMLMSMGAGLLAWAAFIWFYDPDGLRERSRPTLREAANKKQEIDRDYRFTVPCCSRAR